MIVQKIKEAFDPYFEESLENWEKFASLGQVIHCLKGEVLKKSHTIDREIAFKNKYHPYRTCCGILEVSCYHLETPEQV